MEFPRATGSLLHGEDVLRAYVDQQVASLRREMFMLLGSRNSEAPPPELATAEDKSAADGEPITAARLDACAEQELNESVWDCTVFVGLNCLGVVESCFVVFLVLLNIFVQLYFCYIIWSSDMLADPLSPSVLDGLLHFRTGVAHRVENADLISRRSLLAQVCDGDERLHVSGAQLSMHEDLVSFAGQGQLLCLLALLCWSATALGEAGATLRFAQAVLQRRGSRTQVLVKAEGGFVVESLSDWGVAKVFCVTILPRLATVGVLFVIGLLYLSRTSRLEDLLLNAMALAFVLDVDELLFAAFAPHRAKSLVKGTEPLPLAPTRCHPFGPWQAVLRLLAAAAVMLVVWQACLVPFHGRLEQALDILCSGEQNFVYSVNPANGMVISTRSSPPENDWLPAECAVLQLAQPQLESKYGWTPPGAQQCSSHPPASLTEFSKAAFDHVSSISKADVHAAGAGTVCVDEVRGNETPEFLAALREAVDREVDSCAEVKDLCSLHNMTRVRALCAYTCECTFLGLSSAGFFKTADWGCPPQCLAEAKAIEATYTTWGAFPYRCKDSRGPQQLNTSQALALIDKGPDGRLNATELDMAYLQHLVDAEFREDLFLFASGPDSRPHWTKEGLEHFTEVRDLFEHFDLDRDGNLTEAEVDAATVAIVNGSWLYWTREGFQFFTEVFEHFNLDRDGNFTEADVDDAITNASSYDLDGDGSITKAELAGRSAPPAVPPPPAHNSLNWRFGMELYIRGLFEYLQARPNFFESLEVMMPLLFASGGGHELTPAEQERVVDHFQEGAAEDWINDVWVLAPGLPHPRGLERCQFLSSYELQLMLGINLCTPRGVTSLRIVCPESCKCQAEMEECPASCPSLTGLASTLR